MAAKTNESGLASFSDLTPFRSKVLIHEGSILMTQHGLRG